MHPEMLTVVQVDAFGIGVEVARNHDSIGVDHHDLKRKVGKKLAVLRPQRHVEMAGIPGVGVADIEQGLIRGPDRADDLFLEGPGEIGVVLQRGVLGPRSFPGNAVEGSAPDQCDGEDPDQRAANAPGQAQYPVQTGLQPVEHLDCLRTDASHVYQDTASRWTAGKANCIRLSAKWTIDAANAASGPAICCRPSWRRRRQG